MALLNVLSKLTWHSVPEWKPLAARDERNRAAKLAIKALRVFHHYEMPDSRHIRNVKLGRDRLSDRRVDLATLRVDRNNRDARAHFLECRA